LTSTLDRPPARLGAAVGLSCRECGASYPLAAENVCLECFAPLEVAYDFGPVTRGDIESGPRTLWRYAALLPAPPRSDDLAPGCTRLVRADRLAAELGMRSLWIKDDSANPTHSFKDRVVAVATSAARSLGFGTLACASTGNLAGAVAAAAAKVGLRSVVLVPGDLEAAKIAMAAAYGGSVVAFDGTYDEVNRLCSELVGELGWAFVNTNVRPFYAEGSKTVGYEIAEQLGWRLPQQVVVPVASGSLLTKVDKAWRELATLGLVEPAPYAVFGAQGAGCAPVATAYDSGWDVVRPVRPTGIAKSLAIGDPADGPYALDVVRRTGGAITAVDDADIVDGIRLLARTEGVFAETAGGVVVATLRRLRAEGRLDPDAETVILNTGDGLKTLDAVASYAVPATTLAPTLDAFLQAGVG
jgi:threonine synthase